MNQELTGKVIIVTGASRGIGQAIATRLGKEGALVVVNYASSEEGATATVAAIKSAAGSAIALQADVSNAEDVQRLFEQTISEFGRVDALINNAGWKSEDAPIAKTTDSDFDKMLAVNVRSTFLCSREAEKYLQPGGRIINFTSIVTRLNRPNAAVYAAAKAAIEKFTYIHAKELAGRQITVNAIAPGATDTATMRQGKTQDDIQSIIDKTPMKRLGNPEDIADTVVFLLSQQGGWINGQTIHCNGGLG
ncbi:glucose 1-dehydrogenase [Nostoc sp.]|uniref:glucose 1-dehydrogenase n=1 Tax=Nostoc sp. TaxID=1180 RepID=UPI002FF5340C